MKSSFSPELPVQVISRITRASLGDVLGHRALAGRRKVTRAVTVRIEYLEWLMVKCFTERKDLLTPIPVSSP